MNPAAVFIKPTSSTSLGKVYASSSNFVQAAEDSWTSVGKKVEIIPKKKKKKSKKKIDDQSEDTQQVLHDSKMDNVQFEKVSHINEDVLVAVNNQVKSTPPVSPEKSEVKSTTSAQNSQKSQDSTKVTSNAVNGIVKEVAKFDLESVSSKEASPSKSIETRSLVADEWTKGKGKLKIEKTSSSASLLAASLAIQSAALGIEEEVKKKSKKKKKKIVEV